MFRFRPNIRPFFRRNRNFAETLIFGRNWPKPKPNIRSVTTDNHLAKDAIKQHFNPPPALNFGGLWEEGVRSLKLYLYRVIGDTVLNYENSVTLVVQVEAVQNSRTLFPLSSDPNNIDIITPGHFLIGSSLFTVLDPNYALVP